MENGKRKKLLGFVVVLLAGACVLAVMLARGPNRQRTTVGAVEDVVLLPWNVTIQARVDTGATTSSLDAREIKALPGKKEIEFRLPERCGGHLVRRRLHGWREVTSSDGKSERRPLVDLEFLLGDQHIRSLVTLTDRSRMKFPMLLGRNTLRTLYLVDVTQTNLLSPRAVTPAAP
jgi:hypothetical protein